MDINDFFCPCLKHQMIRIATQYFNNIFIFGCSYFDIHCLCIGCVNINFFFFMYCITRHSSQQLYGTVVPPPPPPPALCGHILFQVNFKMALNLSCKFFPHLSFSLVDVEYIICNIILYSVLEKVMSTLTLVLIERLNF